MERVRACYNIFYLGTCGPLCLLVASVMGRHLADVTSRYSEAMASHNLSMTDYELDHPLYMDPAANSGAKENVAAQDTIENRLEQETIGMATTLCLMTGMWQLLLSVVNLGSFRLSKI